MGTRFLMASACALAMFSGKFIFNFGIAERLRTLRYPIFTRGIAKIYGSSYCIFLRENAK